MTNRTISTGNGTSCGWSGNSDLYGPGIRVGLYLQWFATIITTALLPDKELTVHALAMLMQIAVFAGLGLVTTGDETNAVEIVITLWLLLGPLPSLSMRGILQLGTFAGIARPLLYNAFVSYGCWFWFTGVYGLPETPCASIVFWGSTSVNGWFSKLGQAVSIAGIVGSTVALAWSLGKTGTDDFALSRVESKDSDDPQPFSWSYTKTVLFLISFVIIVFTIATVEYLIRVNHVADLGDLSSVGQLVPLLTGCLSMAFCIRDVILKLGNEDSE